MAQCDFCLSMSRSGYWISTMGSGRAGSVEGRVGKPAGRSGPPEPAGGWTPTADRGLRTGPARGPAARRRGGCGRAGRDDGGGTRRLRGDPPAARPNGYEDRPHNRPETWSDRSRTAAGSAIPSVLVPTSPTREVARRTAGRAGRHCPAVPYPDRPSRRGPRAARPSGLAPARRPIRTAGSPGPRPVGRAPVRCGVGPPFKTPIAISAGPARWGTPGPRAAARGLEWYNTRSLWTSRIARWSNRLPGSRAPPIAP